MIAAAPGRRGRGDRHSPAHQGRHRRRHRAPRPRPADPARAGRDRPRRRGGGAEPDPPLGAGQRRRRHGEDDQGRPVRAPAAARPRLPRRVAVRPAAVPRHHGPVVHPPVRRVRHRVPVHQHHDVRRRDRPADQAELVARPDHRLHVRAGAGLLHPVRAAVQGAVPPGAGPGRRPDHAGRGGGDRRARAEGARPRSRSGRGSLRAVHRGLPHPGRQGPPARRLLVGARPDPQRRDRARRGARRDRGQPSHPDPGRAGGLHHAGPDAGMADRGARLRPRLGRGGGDRRAARAGDLRHPAGDPGQNRSSGTEGGASHGSPALRPRVVRLPGEPGARPA